MKLDSDSSNSSRVSKCKYISSTYRRLEYIMLKIKKLFIFSILSFFSFSLLYSSTITIDINGGGNYSTIQEGIDASANGDTVLVYPGTYYENVNFNGKSITLASLELITGDESYADSTVIDGNQTGSCIRLDN